MRIFQVIEASANTGVSANRTWFRNLYEPLVEMGHEVVLFPATDGRTAMTKRDKNVRHRFTEEMFEVFRREQKRKPFQLAFFYLMDGMFDVWAVDNIRRMGIPTCNFSCNNIHQFHLVRDIAVHFDWNLYAEKEAGAKFQSVGATATWWPMASNPTYFHPVRATRAVPVSFSGARYANRLDSIYQLLLNGIDVQVFGPDWKKATQRLKRLHILVDGLKATAKAALGSGEERARRAAGSSSAALHDYVVSRYPSNFHGALSDDDLVTLYSRSEISLGFLNVLENHDVIGRRMRHLHLRDFEAPMCGALYCTDYSDELAEMFEPDKEVVVCHDDIDRTEKVRYFLDHPEQGAKIRQAGRRRALTCHTYQQRFEALFSAIGVKG